MAPKAPQVKQNPYACFKAFFAMRLREKSLQVLYSHPLRSHMVTTQFPGVERFCFPYVENGSPIVSCGDSTFLFILTDDLGNRLFGHCCQSVTSEAYVFVSSHPWVGFFKHMLNMYKGNGCEAGQRLVEALYEATTPPPGDPFRLEGHNMVALRRPRDLPHMLYVDAEPTQLLDVFSDDDLCRIVAALLLERNVVVCGPDFGTVSRVIVSLLGLLAPFEYQHILVSIITSNLLDVLAAPTPFFVGIVEEQLDKVSNITIESAVFVRLRSACKDTLEAARLGHSPSASTQRRSRGDTDIYCDGIDFIGGEPVVLPKSRNVLSSTLRRSLFAIRSQKRHLRRSEDLCAMMLGYYTVRFGLVASPTFSVPAAREYLAKEHKCTNEELRFYDSFFETQCCDALKLYMSGKFADGTWKNDHFCHLAVQRHPSWFEGFDAKDNTLSNVRLDASTSHNVRSTWSLFFPRRQNGCCLDPDLAALDDEEMSSFRGFDPRSMSRNGVTLDGSFSTLGGSTSSHPHGNGSSTNGHTHSRAPSPGALQRAGSICKPHRELHATLDDTIRCSGNNGGVSFPIGE